MFIAGLILGAVLGFAGGAYYGSKNSGAVEAAVEDALVRERAVVAQVGNKVAK